MQCNSVRSARSTLNLFVAALKRSVLVESSSQNMDPILVNGLVSSVWIVSAYNNYHRPFESIFKFSRYFLTVIVIFKLKFETPSQTNTHVVASGRIIPATLFTLSRDATRRASSMSESEESMNIIALCCLISTRQ